MSGQWKPGDVAIVNWPINSDGPFAVIRGHGRWHFLDDPSYVDDQLLTDARLDRLDATFRPLVVIDPEDAEAVKRLADAWYAAEGADLDNAEPMTVRALRMQAALREFANPTPAKPDEPQGLGAVVRDTANELWVRTCYPCDDCLNKPWQRGPVHKNWQIVDAVEVLAEGYDQGAGEPLADWERDLLRGES